MKKYRSLTWICLTATLLISNSCSDLLEEKPKSNVSPAAFNTPLGLLGGIAGVYNDLRNTWGSEALISLEGGTDEHLAGGSAGNPRLFNYNGLTGSDFSGGFAFYTDINTLNGVLELAPSIQELDATTQKTYMGQAQFLRAFLYFHLVQNYRNIPLHTNFVTTPSQADAPASVAEVYEQIVQDLTDAISNLPDKPTAPFSGKAATAGTAKWLLAKVYLTRGWLTDSSQDFTAAYSTATDLINNKDQYGFDLWQDYADAFKPANDYGKENIFVIDHSSDTKYGGWSPGAAGGGGVNVSGWISLFNGPSVLGVNSTYNADTKSFTTPTAGNPSMLTRDVQFGRPYTRIRPNMPPLASGPNAGKSYLLDQAFPDRTNDSRYNKTFQTVWLFNSGPNGGGGLANVGTYAGPSVSATRGTETLTTTAGLDTAVWFADHEIEGAPQFAGTRPFKGIIVTPRMQTATIFPYMKKFADPSRPAVQDPSTRPVVIARFSEVYLIAAEAAFKLGQQQNAADMINVVRQRAAYRTGTPYVPGGAFGASTTPAQMIGDPYPAGVTFESAKNAVTVPASSITLDFILDERTREFYGEHMRWLDLARTQSLLKRVQDWNPVEAGTNIKDFHALRPIPQDEINYVTTGEHYPQNAGY